ncbi:MAG: serine/threonine protein phosphatase 1 [Lentimonas sp.]|jgi:serine/threonine protein phosphatase 1
MPRTIAIGDVHGCADEFEELLCELKICEGDRLIQVGDLINRGPDSRRAIELARRYKVEVILGNHELRLLRSRRKNQSKILKDYDMETIRQLGDDDWNFLERFPAHIHDLASDTVFIHGGFLAHKPWRAQSLDITTRIQVIDRNGRAAKRSDAPDGVPWADSWAEKREDNPFVVYGHTPRALVLQRKGSIGIDTGCVYGGHLTAYIIEEARIVQVRAHKAYAHSKRLPDPV